MHGTRFSWNSSVRTEPSQRGQSPTAPFVPRGLILLAEAQEICGGSHHEVLALPRRQQTRFILLKSGPCADGVHCSYGIGTRRAGAILQVPSTGYVHRPLEAILSSAVVSGGECEGEAGKKEGSNMKVNEIGIHAGNFDHPYRTVGEISAKVEAATRFPKTPTLEDINFKLQEKASQLGANAVIKVEYNRGMSQAHGAAAVLESDEVNWATEFLEYQR